MQISCDRGIGSVFVWVIALAMAFIIGKLITSFLLVAFLIALIPIFILVIFKAPVLLYFIYIFIIFHGGGFAPLDILYFIPGVGKLSDILGMALFAVFVLHRLTSQLFFLLLLH